MGALIEDKKRVLLIGLGSHALALADLLQVQGREVACVERLPRSSFSGKEEELCRLEQAGVQLHFGVDGEQVAAIAERFSVCAVSSGITRESAVYGALRRLPLTMTSEFEIALTLWPGQTVLITGSNGKSTAAALTEHVLCAGGRDVRRVSTASAAFVRDLARHAARASERSIAVIDVSGYELDFCSSLKPSVAVFLNLFDKDIERYGSEARSFEMKKTAFANLTQSELAVINRDDRWGRELLRTTGAGIATFGTGPDGSGFRAEIHYQPDKGMDLVRLGRGSEQIEVQTSGLLAGLHNRYNIAAALLVAVHFGLSADNLEEAIANFRPLPHRLEHLAGASGPICINDSRSTSVAAVMAACRTVREQYQDKPLFLLIGGRARAGSWIPAVEELQKKWRPREVICFGEDGHILASHCKSAGVPHRREALFADAVAYALRSAGPDGIVLLSPGCASFDEFTDFEERGNVFKSLVHTF